MRLAVRQYRRLHVALHHGVDVLDCREGIHLLGTVDDVHVHLREAPAVDIALLHELAHRLGHALDGRAAHTVQVIELHVVGLQAPHRRFQVRPQLVVDRAAAKVAATQEELGGQHHVVAHVMQGLAHDALVVADPREPRAVHLGRVEEGAAVLVGAADGLDAVLLGRNLPIAVGEGHAAHPHLGDL